MMEAHEILKKINYYMNLKDRVQRIINNLNLAIDNLQTPSTKISECYTIDGEPADKNKIAASRSESIEIRDYLNSTILLAIDQEIRKLRTEKSAVEAAIGTVI